MKRNLQKETVQISGMEFYAYHGVYPEETTLGRKFTVNASFLFEAPTSGFNQNKTGALVDYAIVYKLTSQVMSIRHDYLEDLCQSLMVQFTEKLFIQVPFTLSIQVIKHDPPVGGVVGESVVEQEWICMP